MTPASLLSSIGLDAETVSTFSAAWLEGAVDVAAKGTLLLLAAWAVASVSRRASAAVRGHAWAMGLCGALALPLAFAVAPSWHFSLGLQNASPARTASPSLALAPLSPKPFFEAPAPMTRAEVLAARMGSSESASTAPLLRRANAEALPAAGMALPAAASLPEAPAMASPAPASEAASVAAAAPAALHWSAWAMLAWAAGALACLGRLALGMGRVWTMGRRGRRVDDLAWRAALCEACAEMGLSRRPRLLESPDAAAPMTWGWLRPAIMLPAGARKWSAGRRRAVLLHEAAHIARRDWPVQIIACAARALNWFNPLFWMAWSRLMAERESACDDLALNAGEPPADYARHLVEIARERWASLRDRRVGTLAVAAAVQKPSELERRARAILDAARARRAPGRWASRLAAVGAIAAAVFLAALRPAEAQGWTRDRDALLADAERHYENKEWAKAAEAYEKALATDGRAWFNMGFARHNLGEFETSLDNFERSYALGHEKRLSAFNAACACARLGRPDAAFEWLGHAVTYGFEDPVQLGADDDLSSLRGDARFYALSERLEKISESRQAAGLAFERGDWQEASDLFGILKEARGALGPSESFNHGYALLKLGHPPEASEAFEWAVDLGEKRVAAPASYNVACCRALAGNEADALAWLEKAIGMGFADAGLMASDPDLESLRGNERFQAMLKRLEGQPKRVVATTTNVSKSLFGKKTFSVKLSYGDGSNDVVEVNLNKLLEGELGEKLGPELADKLREAALIVTASDAGADVFVQGEADPGRLTVILNEELPRALWNAEKRDKEAAEAKARAAYQVRASARPVAGQDASALERDWAAYLAEIETEAGGKPPEGAALFERALALHMTGEYASAREAFTKCFERGVRSNLAAYNVACGYALEGRAADALAWLEKAARNGFEDHRLMESDSDLESLRQDPRFQALLEQLRAQKSGGIKTFFGWGASSAAEPEPEPLPGENASALERDWNAYLAELEAEAKAAGKPPEGVALFEKGLALHMTGQRAPAREVFEQCFERDIRPNLAAYNIACGYALEGRAEQALAWLEKAAENGFDNHRLMESDSDLQSLREEPRFKELLDRLRAQNPAGLKAFLTRSASSAAERGAEAAQAAADVAREKARLARLEAQEALEEAQKMAAEASAQAKAAAAEARGEAAFVLGEARSAARSLLVREEKASPEALRARELYAAKDWAAAAEAYAPLEKRDQLGAGDLFNYGFALHQAGRYEEAIRLFQRSLDRGNASSACAYNIACGHARLGEKALALDWLEKAVESGFGDADLARSDSDLESLRGDERFESLLGGD